MAFLFDQSTRWNFPIVCMACKLCNSMQLVSEKGERIADWSLGHKSEPRRHFWSVIVLNNGRKFTIRLEQVILCAFWTNFLYWFNQPHILNRVSQTGRTRNQRNGPGFGSFSGDNVCPRAGKSSRG